MTPTMMILRVLLLDPHYSHSQVLRAPSLFAFALEHHLNHAKKSSHHFAKAPQPQVHHPSNHFHRHPHNQQYHTLLLPLPTKKYTITRKRSKQKKFHHPHRTNRPQQQHHPCNPRHRHHNSTTTTNHRKTANQNLEQQHPPSPYRMPPFVHTVPIAH